MWCRRSGLLGLLTGECYHHLLWEHTQMEIMSSPVWVGTHAIMLDSYLHHVGASNSCNKSNILATFLHDIHLNAHFHNFTVWLAICFQCYWRGLLKGSQHVWLIGIFVNVWWLLVLISIEHILHSIHIHVHVQCNYSWKSWLTVCSSCFVRSASSASSSTTSTTSLFTSCDIERRESKVQVWTRL